MAELDADAASRGMGASTYVTSVKGREMANTERDVALLESNYAASLSERVASYLQYYANLDLQAQMQNAQLAYTAQNAAAKPCGAMVRGISIGKRCKQRRFCAKAPFKRQRGGGRCLFQHDPGRIQGLCAAHERSGSPPAVFFRLRALEGVQG